MLDISKNTFKRITTILAQEWLLLLVLTVAAFLRYYDLSKNSLWYDDLRLLKIIHSNSFSNIINHLHNRDTHLPVFYFIIFILDKTLGNSEIMTRFVSSTFGLLSALAIYRFVTKIYDKRTAIISTIWIALSPFLVFYSRSGMMYSFLLFISILTTQIWINYFSSRPNIRNALFYIFASALTCYTHYYGLLLYLTHSLLSYFFFYRKNSFKTHFIPQAIIALLFLPWIPAVFRSFNNYKWWMNSPTITTAWEYLQKLLLVDYFGHYFSYFMVLIILLSHINKPFKITIRKNSFLLFCIILVPYSIMVTKSLLSAPAMNLKYFITFMPYFFTLLAIPINKLSKSTFAHISVCMILIIILTSASVFNRYYTPQQSSQRQLVQELIKEHQKTPQALFLTRGVFLYYCQYYNYSPFYNENLYDDETLSFNVLKNSIENSTRDEIVFAYNLKQPSKELIVLLSTRYDLVSQKTFWSYSYPAAITRWKKSW